jgi:hypothetical protein
MAASTTPDVVDVTDLVEKTRSSFVTWGVDFLMTAMVAVPYLGPISKLPIISSIFKMALTFALSKMSESAVMGAFFMNTVLRKATDAGAFVQAADALANLPKDVSDADYAKAEQAQISAFNDFVTLSGD